MDQVTRQLLEAINTLNRNLQGEKRFQFLGNSDRINSDGLDVSEQRVRSFVEIADASRTAIRNEQKRMDNFFKGMSRGASILDGFYHRVKKSNEQLEAATKNQKDAFKRSAKNMEAFTRSTFNNTEKLDKTTEKLDAIDKAVKDLQEKTKKKVEIEQEIQNLTGKHLKKQVELSKNTDNYSTEQERVYRARLRLEKQLKSAKKDEVDEIKEAIANLEKARKMLMDLQETDSFENVRSAIKGIEGWGKSDDEHLRAIHAELQAAGGTNEQIIEHLKAVKDTVDGAKVGFGMVYERNTNKLIELSEKRNRILESLGPQLLAGLADASRREMTMLETRQQRMGTQSWALMPRAMAMGMSEADLLMMTDENRYLLRRMALTAGEEGEVAYLRGDFRREVQELGKELGFIGADAMRGMLEIADALRVVGIDASTETLRDMTSFIKDSHVQFGLTQEQMVGAFRDMTEEGLMAIRFMHRDDSLEAMQEEISARLHLGRLLNQDIETMKRREREMAARVTGDPAEMFRRSIMAGILASQHGFSREDQDLIRRRFRGDQSMTEAEAQRAMRLELDLRTTAAQSRAASVTGGNAFDALVTHRFMEMAGIDIQEATLEVQRRMAGVDERTTRSDEPARRLNEFSQALMRSKEMLRGVTESSFGMLTAALFSSVAALAHLTFHAWAAGLSLGRLGMGPLGPGGRGRAAATMALRSVPFAAASTGVIMGGMNLYTGRQQAHAQFDAGIISELQRDQQLRSATYAGVGQVAGTMGGALAGAKAGAALGSFAPGIGTAIGGVIGAGVGYFAGDALGRTLADSTQQRGARSEIARLAMGQSLARYGVEYHQDGTLSLHRHIMGQTDHIKLGEERSTELKDLMEREATIKSLLGHEGLQDVMSRSRRRQLESELSTIQSQQRAYLADFSPTELERSRTDLFEAIDKFASHSSDTDAMAAAQPHLRGMLSASTRGETMQLRQSLIEAFAGLEDKELSLMFETEERVLETIRTLQSHTAGDSQIREEILERLETLLIDINSNTERSADAEEQSLSHLRKQLGMASASYWEHQVGDLASAVDEMSRPRDVTGAFE